MRYIKINNEIGTINIQGEWTLLEPHDIEEEVGEAYGKGINNYIVDFAGTETIDYASVQFLTELHSRVGEGKLTICNVNPKGLVYYMLDKAGLTALIR